jgi:hypothetical protein
MAAVKGEGTVTLEIESSRTLRVTGVLFVPGMRVNVLSVAALEDQGYGVEFYGRGVHMFLYMARSSRGTCYDRPQ